MTTAKCELCGEPMPPGEEMFKYHGYSGPCPKEPLPRTGPTCGKCGGVMTPENAQMAPELFLHDACLDDEFIRETCERSEQDRLRERLENGT